MKTSRIAKVMLALAVAASSMATMAQTQLKASTGSATGTYSRMFKEFSTVCKDQIPLIEVASTGSVQNLDRLLGNEVNAAIVQTDALFHRATTEDLSGVKTLFSLHPEEVHLVALRESKIKEGGVAGFGSKPVQINAITDLAGRSVAAWGGSFITAQVIRLQSEVQYSVVEVDGFKKAKELLDSGAVAAILMVGGQPMADIAALNAAYKLVPFNEAVIGRLKNVYVSAKLNYGNLGSGGQGVQTVATEALFVTRSYKTPKYVESLAALRNCFKSNVDELAETTGTHKKWAAVKAENEGKWSYYQLPATAQPAQKKR